MIPFGLSAGVLDADATIQSKTYVSGTTTLIVSNEEIEVVRKI